MIMSKNWLDGYCITTNFKEGKMSRRILTQNIVLLIECMNEKCNNADTMSIEDMRDFGPPGRCPSCDDYLMIGREAIIKN